MDLHQVLLMQDVRADRAIPADFYLWMPDEVQYIENVSITDFYYATLERIAAVVYFRPYIRFLAASVRAHLYFDEVKKEVGSWGKGWPISGREKLWLKEYRLAG